MPPDPFGPPENPRTYLATHEDKTAEEKIIMIRHDVLQRTAAIETLVKPDGRGDSAHDLLVPHGAQDKIVVPPLRRDEWVWELWGDLYCAV